MIQDGIPNNDGFLVFKFRTVIYDVSLKHDNYTNIKILKNILYDNMNENALVDLIIVRIQYFYQP